MTSNQESMTVIDLAKELGAKPLALLEDITKIGIRVKSHMSELTDDQVRQIREALAPKTEEKKAAPKKKTTTRKAAVKTAAAPAEEAQPASDAKTKTKVVRKKSASATTSTDDSGTEVSSSRSTVIRRRTTLEDGAETVTMTAVTQIQTEMVSEEPTSKTKSTRRKAGKSEVSSTTEGTTSEPTPSGSSEVSGAEDVSSSVVQSADSTSGEPLSTSESVPADTTTTTTTTIEDTPSSQIKRTVLTVVERKTLPARPALKTYSMPSPAPKTAAAKSPAEGAEKPRDFQIQRLTKENLDRIAAEEATKKRGLRDAEVKPEDVRFADYKRKEVVFLPKKKKIPVGKELKKTQITTPKAIKRVVEMHDSISIQDFAAQMNVKAIDVVRKLMGMGQMVTINSVVDFDTASLIASEFQFEVKNIAFKEEEVLSASATDKPEELKPRPPIVTIMGHVDHGKTSLLDAIREANVAAGEAGGITQHIGAYTIEKNGHQITFIDTPGHEAFSMMRARGANVTDIVILVVAADDGVMPQTREAINHARAANVPIIVAVNKMDKPGANPERIKQSLAELNLLAEDWGGDVMFVPVSALQKTNLDKLLESILLQAEVLELKANPNARASGIVLESRLEKGRGPVISALIKRGTLRVGDPLVAGVYSGRVRAMADYRGLPIQEVSPGMAAEIIGLEGVPGAGDIVDSTESESDAHQVAKTREEKARAQQVQARSSKMSLDDLFSKIQSGETKELRVILKADVVGSLEAIRDTLEKQSTDKVKINVIHAAAGGITESDVLLASASNAIIVGFNVRPETGARQTAEREHIEIKCYTIIYELVDEIKTAMAGMLDKKKVEKFLGRAEVRQTFAVPKSGVIAGSSVIDGKIVRGANVRLLRDNRIIYEGKMSSLRRFKDDAKEVAQGYECGIGIESYNDIKPGDVIEAYQIELVSQEL